MNKTYQLAEGHPRVLLRAEDLPALRRKAETTHRKEYESLLELHEKHAAAPIEGDGGEVAFRLAFLALISGDKSHLLTVERYLEHVLTLPVSGEYWVGARRLKALACSYDWFHATLSPALRARIGEACMAYSQALYDTEEIEEGCYLLGHAINQMPFVLMAGIATADEIGERAHHFIADMLRRTKLQLECYRNFLEKDCFQQSMSYTSTYMGELPWLFQAIEKGLGQPMFAPNAWWANVVKWWTYGFRDDQSFVRYGDYFCAMPALSNAQYQRPFITIAAKYNDGRAQWWADRCETKTSEPDLILFDERPGVAPIPPDDLPRTRLFEPMGLAVVRGDFDTSAPGKGGTVAAFKCTPVYLHNHGHRDANSFTIYHKGELAIDSGAYDAYETPHWYNYYVRSIAHNTLVVEDPNEVFVSRGKQYSNDGGQRFINSPHFQARTIEDVRGDAFRDGKIIRHQEGGGFSYVCGDASNCYDVKKLKRFVRHVVFVLDHPHKGAVSLLVVDDVELARPDLTPRFLLHTMNEPKVSGNTITATHNAGRLTATVLEPTVHNITLIGGEGHEFEVNGENYALNRKLGPAYMPGSWRAEVTPTAQSLTHRFVTLLVPADVDRAAEPSPKLQSKGNELAVTQGGLKIVLRLASPGVSVQITR